MYVRATSLKCVCSGLHTCRIVFVSQSEGALERIIEVLGCMKVDRGAWVILEKLPATTRLGHLSDLAPSGQDTWKILETHFTNMLHDIIRNNLVSVWIHNSVDLNWQVNTSIFIYIYIYTYIYIRMSIDAGDSRPLAYQGVPPQFWSAQVSWPSAYQCAPDILTCKTSCSSIYIYMYITEVHVGWIVWGEIGATSKWKTIKVVSQWAYVGKGSSVSRYLQSSFMWQALPHQIDISASKDLLFQRTQAILAQASHAQLATCLLIQMGLL